jgi:hypothetical protein
VKNNKSNAGDNSKVNPELENMKYKDTNDIDFIIDFDDFDKSTDISDNKEDIAIAKANLNQESNKNIKNSSNSIFVHEYEVSNDDYKYVKNEMDNYNDNKARDNENLSSINHSSGLNNAFNINNDTQNSISKTNDNLSKEDKDKYLHVNGRNFDRTLGIDDTDYNSDEEKAKYEEFYNKYQAKDDKKDKSEGIKNKLSKFNFKAIYFISSTVFFIIAIILSFILISSKPDSIDITDGEFNDVEFMTRIIYLSGTNSKENYDKLKSITSIKNNKNSTTYNEMILDIRESFESNLIEINTLKDYVDEQTFEPEINLLRERCENAIKLCNEMISYNSGLTSIYNKYAQNEIEIVSQLNDELMKNLDEINIDYTYENGVIIIED